MRLLFIDLTIPHLFVDADYPVGGWAVELRAWLQGFRAAGAETAILTDEAAPDAAERNGETRLLRVYAARRLIPGFYYLFRFLPRMVAQARAWRPDVVIQAVCGVNTALMMMLARLVRRPFVYRCANDIDVDDRYRARLGNKVGRLFAFGFARADAYVAQNSYQLNAIRARFPGKPAIVLHNPYQAQRDRVRVPRTERGYVAWLGVLQAQKNLPLLARIAQSLPDVPFRIAGRPDLGQHEPELFQALEQLRALPNVTFVGYLKRSEVPDFLAHAVLLLSTSHYEGFSNTFLEAWGAGTPMVAPTRVDPDALIAEQGLGIAATDDDALVDGVRTVMAMEPAEWDRLSAHCRNHAETAHDPEALARRLIAFCRDLPRK